MNAGHTCVHVSSGVKSLRIVDEAMRDNELKPVLTDFILQDRFSSHWVICGDLPAISHNRSAFSNAKIGDTVERMMHRWLRKGFNFIFNIGR